MWLLIRPDLMLLSFLILQTDHRAFSQEQRCSVSYFESVHRLRDELTSTRPLLYEPMNPAHAAKPMNPSEPLDSDRCDRPSYIMALSWECRRSSFLEWN